MQNFAALLVEARGRVSLTQSQLAAAAGLTPSYLSFIENRKKPPPSDEVCERLARVLGIPARRLIEVAHMERAPVTVQRKVRTLSRSLQRERRSGRRTLKSLLSPFLFAGPPGYLESALEAVPLNPLRRRRIRQVLGAIGRKRQDREREISRLVDELPERERTLLLEALPALLSKDVEASADLPTPADAPAATPADAPASGSSRPPDPPLLYAPPDGGQAGRPYLLVVDSEMAAPFEEVREGDRILVDPGAGVRPGDLLVFRGERGESGAVLRRLDADGAAGYRLTADDRGRGYEHLTREELAERMARLGGGTVLEVRRALRAR